jgi:hypothetical protein
MKRPNEFKGFGDYSNKKTRYLPKGDLSNSCKSALGRDARAKKIRADKKQIIKMYTAKNPWTIREIAMRYETNVAFIRKMLIEWGFNIK